MSTTRANEEILGYRLEERIGAGGFGEVWRAEAPGGLYKAIKIVFGYHDEDLAQSELKALNRVKELRHPFLLSLERIEIVDGQLIVVTELADRSLKDRFVEAIHQGNPGIPRDELVKYLSDAADGLDFLCQKYLLQHLDVKPDNLLLVGEHVKVADYGLVKDIRDNASMLSGMTPTYSPPEVFDGRPSQLSDQYSLAVVYQEMLTGVRPFDGTTTSELARQHMLGHPNLEPLPRGDQSVVAKALSKDPSHRYGSCKEFIEQLARRKNTGSVAKATEPHEFDFNEPTMVLTGSDLPKKRCAELAQRMPAIECDGTFAAMHPTVVIGIGSAGTAILRRIKQRLVQRFGRQDELPAVHMLCIDSDVNELYRTLDNDDAQFRDEEVLGVPLHEAAFYRKTGDRYSKWLSRRWIYNIPRSRSTEGIRPLGRLAFADHADQIMDRLHEITQTLGSPIDIEKSSMATGMPPNATPRVFIVGSLGGGICSGMVSDLAYAVRTVLLEHGFSDELIHGIFLYGKGRTQSESALAAANAYACLRELHHYAKLGYPGDVSLDLPPFDDGNTAAFSDIYFVHHGEDPASLHQQSVADYLYLDIATNSNDFFKRCRTGREDDGKLRLRTLGFSRFDFQQERTRAKFARAIQENLFTRWVAPVEEPIKNFDVAEFVETQMAERNISGERFVEHGNTIAEALYGSDIPEFIRSILARIVDPNSVNERVRELTRQVYDILHQHADRPADATLLSIEENIVPICKEVVGDLWDACGALIDDHSIRYGGAKLVHDTIQERLRSSRSEFRRKKTELEDELEKIDADHQTQQIEDGVEPRPLDVAKLAVVYSRIARINCADALVEKIQQSSRPLKDEFERIRQLFEAAQKAANGLAEANIPPQGDGPNFETIIRGFLTEHVSLFVTMLESHTDRSFFNSLGGLRKVAETGALSASQLANSVFCQSRFLVAGSFQGINFDAVLDAAVPKTEDLKLIVNDQLKDSLPKLTDCGGGLRLMLAVPVSTPGKRLAKHCAELFNGDPTIVRGTDGDLAICLEGESVQAEDVALLLLEESPTATEYIERIASRLDVEWIPITGLG